MQRLTNTQIALLVQRRAEPLVVQRDGDFGLRTSAIQDPYIASAVAWIQNPTNATKTAVEYVDYLASLAAKDLTAMGCKSPTVANLDTGYSTFGRVGWAVEVNTLRVAGGATTKAVDLGVDKASKLAGTIFHEFRHAEQYFKICQVLAGEGKTKAEIEAYTDIPSDVVDQAVAKPIKASATNAAEIATIKTWESITVGSNSNYKVLVNDMDDEMDVITDLMASVDKSNRAATSTELKPKMARLKGYWTTQFTAECDRLTAIAKPSPFDTVILGRVNGLLAAIKAVTDGWSALKTRSVSEIQGLYPTQRALNDMTFALYQAHEHEVDARAVAAPVTSGVTTGMNAPPPAPPKPPGPKPAAPPAALTGGEGNSGKETPALESNFASLMSFWKSKANA